MYFIEKYINYSHFSFVVVMTELIMERKTNRIPGSVVQVLKPIKQSIHDTC